MGEETYLRTKTAPVGTVSVMYENSGEANTLGDTNGNTLRLGVSVGLILNTEERSRKTYFTEATHTHGLTLGAEYNGDWFANIKHHNLLHLSAVAKLIVGGGIEANLSDLVADETPANENIAVDAFAKLLIPTAAGFYALGGEVAQPLAALRPDARLTLDWIWSF